MKLTRPVIDGLRFTGATPESKCVVWDDEIPSFGVRVMPSGVKTFVIQYRHRGRRRYFTLGAYGVLTLTQARDQARLRLSDVLRGGDPQAERQRLRHGATVADLAKVYLERHASRNKSLEKDRDRLQAHVLPAFGAWKVDAVQRPDVARLHQKIGKTRPTTANRVLALMSSMWNRARLDFGILPQTHPNPTEGIRRFPEVKRDRFLTKDEMPRLAAAIDEEPNHWLKALIWLYLFTGLRATELRTLRWKDVDLKEGRIRLGETKAGRPHYLPVSSLARAMFDRIVRMHGNPYVFCGRNEGAHLVNVKDPWIRIREKAGLQDVRLHDLRRTVGSWMAQQGETEALIGRVLNHSNVSTTRIYARFNLDPVAEALENVGRALVEASHVEPPGEDAKASSVVD